jgi:hypothetical protein
VVHFSGQDSIRKYHKAREDIAAYSGPKGQSVGPSLQRSRIEEVKVVVVFRLAASAICRNNINLELVSTCSGSSTFA